MSEDYLAHHGVLGMKWGVRRYQPYGGGTYEPEHRGRFVGKNGAKGSVTTRRSIKKQYRADVRNAHAGYNADVKSAAKRLDSTYDPKKHGVRNNPQMTKYAEDVHRAEIKRDKALSKAEQNYRSAKTAQKQTRADAKAYEKDYKRAEKTYNRALKKNPEAPEYAKVQAQKASELTKSKKAAAFRNAMTNHTEFTLDDMANYNDEVARIGKKYKNQTVNAMMKDLKIEDTKGARAFVEKMVESEYSLDNNDKRTIVPHH